MHVALLDPLRKGRLELGDLTLSTLSALPDLVSNERCAMTDTCDRHLVAGPRRARRETRVAPLGAKALCGGDPTSERAAARRGRHDLGVGGAVLGGREMARPASSRPG